jgi:FkbM family methyltransferase
METLKRAVKRLAYSAGFQIIRTQSASVGRHKLGDVGRALAGESTPVIFDIGANVGQSVQGFKDLLPQCVIHSFEPSPAAFRKLSAVANGFSDVHPLNVGLAAAPGELELLENSSSVMNSFLPTGRDGWGNIVNRVKVPVTTIDAYCAAQGIGQVSLAKIDTQGFDVQVLRGAERTMRAGRVKLVLIEITFSDMYRDGAAPDQVYALLRGYGFRLVSFYELQYRNNLADWCDALFCHESQLEIVGAKSK